MGVFKCLKCGGVVDGWPPLACSSCHAEVIRSGNIYITSDDPGINLDDSGPKYIGYDKIAEHYDASRSVYGKGRDCSDLGKAISNLLGTGKVVLDIGAGTGYHDIPIAQAGNRVIAGDVSLKMLEIMSSKLDRVPFGSILSTKMNAFNLPIVDETIDAVMSISVLHLVENPELVVEEIKRLMKSDAVFITAFIENNELPTAVEEKNKIFYQILQRFNNEYRKLVRKAGMEFTKRPGWWPYSVMEAS